MREIGASRIFHGDLSDDAGERWWSDEADLTSRSPAGASQLMRRAVADEHQVRPTTESHQASRQTPAPPTRAESAGLAVIRGERRKYFPALRIHPRPDHASVLAAARPALER